MDIQDITVIPIMIFGMVQMFLAVLVMAFLFKVASYFFPR